MVINKYLNTSKVSFRLTFFVFLFVFFQVNGENYNFSHLHVEDGLSQSTVFSIYKDQKGFIWFGTRRGLNRYDGYDFEYFMHDVKNPNSINSDIIYSIIGDKKDNLIIQTDISINYFNRYLGKISPIPTYERFWNFIKDRENNIWACSASGIYIFNDHNLTFDTIEHSDPFTGLFDLTLDKSNNIWLTGAQGVICYNPGNREYKIYEITGYPQPEMENIFIETGNDGRLWICLRNGELLYFDEDTKSFTRYAYNKPEKNILVTSFGNGLNNTIIVGTDGNGIIQIDAMNGEQKNYNHVPDNKSSLSSNTIYSIFADNKLGILWLGSYMGGIDYYYHYDKGFNFIYHEPYNKKSIINNNIRSLFNDNLNNIWIGTRQGISVIDQANNVIAEYSQQKLLAAGITNPIVTEMWQDPSGYIWICSYKGGIIIYSPSQNKFLPVSRVYPNINLPDNLGIFDMMMDSKENIWIATDKGTYLIPRNKSAFIFDNNFSKKIIEDRAGRVFIGTAYNGMFMVTHTLQITEVAFKGPGDSEKIARINTLFEDSEGNIWIGTGGKGVVKYNPTLNISEHLTVEEGLPDNNIAGIIEDNNHIIWTTTYSGLARYYKDKKRFKHIYLEKMIKGKEFNPNSIIITGRGTIYAGSINGLLKFEPLSYKENPYLPEVIFTELWVNNQKVIIDQKNPPIEKAMMFTDRINLKYNQKSIVLKYTAPEYLLGDKVKFSYQFGEGQEPWIGLGNNRSLNIVDLKAGEYILKVRAANSDGYFKTEGTTLLIHVEPPPWKTTFAYLMYGFALIALLLLSRSIIRSKLKLKYEILLHKAEKEKQEEINHTRIRLFTDISHEIGTSLTLLNVPLETLNNIENDDLKKHYLLIINKNVQKLIHLVKRIIELRKVETKNISLLAVKDDFISFVKAVCINFESIARRKNISFIRDFPIDPVYTWFDKEKTENIIINLLSNAFKFEPENGKVFIGITKENGTIKGAARKLINLKVNNKGSYIPPEKAEHIFERFHKDSSGTLGGGIGLSLTHAYTEIHKGEIQVWSSQSEGVTFEVKLPYGESYLAPEEKIANPSNYEIKAPYFDGAETEISHLIADHEHDEKNKILIAENNAQLQQLLKEHFSSHYEIIEAHDAEEAFLKTRNFQPDLVISDLNTQNGEGIDLCRSIKNEFDIGHIPVIILAANDDIEEKIKGMEAGADAFINKPFSINYLHSAIKNLIGLRKKLKKKYNKQEMIIDDEINIPSINDNFLEKAHAVIEKNLDNTRFGIPEFINQLGISKYMLYSKIKTLTGQTPNDFILSYKLKKAAQVLKSKEISDNDLYYKLGFNDISYFRKCFKKHYGITPNQYIKSNKFIR
ncbi:MAG: response regulator [Bacteroidales bacterium]|nr:response regulator [Bacteroidales bacterium]